MKSLSLLLSLAGLIGEGSPSPYLALTKFARFVNGQPNFDGSDAYGCGFGYDDGSGFSFGFDGAPGISHIHGRGDGGSYGDGLGGGVMGG